MNLPFSFKKHDRAGHHSRIVARAVSHPVGVLLIEVAVLAVVMRSHVMAKLVGVAEVVEAVGTDGGKPIPVLAEPVEPPEVTGRRVWEAR